MLHHEALGPGVSIDSAAGRRGTQCGLQRSLLLTRDAALCCAARQAIQWLERKLTARGTTLAMVTHDRAFMEATCTGVLELDAGGAHLHGFGGPGSYARFRQARNGSEIIPYHNLNASARRAARDASSRSHGDGVNVTQECLLKVWLVYAQAADAPAPRR